MIYLSTFVSILEVILLSIPVVLAVAYVTVAERKTMASMQRRLGPNIVGYYGLLQAFADAFKLLLKEYVSPTQANLILFFLGPIITLMFSLLGYGVIPYAPGLTIFDFNLGILYLLAVSSLSTYGILLAGWSANSKYAFLGSLRSTAQLISYELILSSAILLVVLLTSSLNLTVNIEYQKAVWFLMPLFPVFIIFFISSVAETNRAPFDLAEAESELVSGFMTEHAAVIFVFFFLAEYASIVLICILTSILFLGGYLLNIVPLLYILYYVDIVTIIIVNVLDYFFSIMFGGSLGNFADNIDYFSSEHFKYFIYSLNDNKVINNPLIEGIVCGIILGIKSSLMIFVFIWVRASFPRIRFDQLMSFCWTVLLPLVFAFIVLVPCILYSFEILPNNILL
jgi:NADH-ubiquinone oxidoreductase chain 1